MVGVDISPAMISVAKREMETEDCIEYMVANCSKDFGMNQEFDIVSSAYLLNYR